jgi:hypothetical protein
MTITTITSREFNQDVGTAKRSAILGPVFITDRGRPAHVLLSIEEYLKLSGGAGSIVDMLAMPESADDKGTDDFDFEPPRLDSLYRPENFS